MPLDLQQAFANDSARFIVGTGLLINDDSQILTAAHVARAAQDIAQKLTNAGIPFSFEVAFVQNNIYTSNGDQTRMGTLLTGARIVYIDYQSDLAVLQLQLNPETMGSRVNGKSDFTAPKPLKFSIDRPRDGDDVFACGFPFGSVDLVSTTGHMASAEAFEPLVISQNNGFPGRVDVFKVDLRISPGNSGGPLFRESDNAVMGIVVEATSGGGYAIAVPAEAITKSLTAHGIKWNAAAKATSPSTSHKTPPR